MWSGFDETTLRCGAAGAKKYVLSASTEEATAYHLGGRDLDSFAEFGILPAFTGIAVHDRYGNYFHPAGAHCSGIRPVTHICCGTSPTPPRPTPRRIGPSKQRALRGLIAAWHAARDVGDPAIAEAVRDELALEFRRAVRVGLSQVPRVPGPRNSTAQRPGRELLEFCRDREDDVLRFSLDTRIWPTNHISERDLRPTKTQQKISGRLTSDTVTQDRLDIRSYIDTARKQGINVMAALRRAVVGNPWRPPSPAPS